MKLALWLNTIVFFPRTVIDKKDQWACSEDRSPSNTEDDGELLSELLFNCNQGKTH